MRSTARGVALCGVAGCCLLALSAAAQGVADGGESEYAEAVERIQVQRGPFDVALVENLLGLGLTHQFEGRHPEAIDELMRALQVARVNAGLENPVQVPILEAMIRSHRAMRDWQEVDRRYHYITWLAHRDGSPRTLEALYHAGAWRLEAATLRVNTGRSAYEHLIEAERVYLEALNRVQGAEPADARKPLYGLALTYMRIATAIDRLRPARRRYNPARNEGLYLLEKMEREQAMRRAYFSGRDALQRALDLIPIDDSTVVERAEAMARLADWELMFDRPALDLYQGAHDLLASSSDADVDPETFFASPRPLPAFEPPMADDSQRIYAGQSPVPFVLATLNVDARGNPSAVRIAERSADADMEHERLTLRRVQSAKFRPKLVSGNPVPVDDVQVRFEFADG